MFLNIMGQTDAEILLTDILMPEMIPEKEKEAVPAAEMAIQTEEILPVTVQKAAAMEEMPETQIETARQITAAEHQQQVLQEEAEMEETVLLKAAEEVRAAAIQRTVTVRTEEIQDLQAGHIMTMGMTMMQAGNVLILIIGKHRIHMKILKKVSRGNDSWILKIWLTLKMMSLNSFEITKTRRITGIF